MTSSNNQMHNDIMAAGSKERPPMLAPELLRKCIYEGPYKMTENQLEDTHSNDENRRQPGQIVKETYANTSPENQKLIDAEAEAVHMILNGIGNDIYSTVDACLPMAKICGLVLKGCNKESLSTYKMLRLSCFGNLVSSLQGTENKLSHTRQDTYPQAPKTYKTHAPSSRQTTSTRSHAPTRNKGKKMIVKAPSPPFESASNEDNDKEQSQRDKTSLNTMNKNVDTSPRIGNDRQTGQFRNQRTITVVGKRESVRN
ncbi:hypothetical protein Tco_0912629 [Tanacetum coccineum]